MNYPDPTYVCRVSGLSSSNWSALEQRIGDDLIFPVNDCTTQVDSNGNTVTASRASRPTSTTSSASSCCTSTRSWTRSRSGRATPGAVPDLAPLNMTPTSPDIDLDTSRWEHGCTPYDAISQRGASSAGHGYPQCCTLEPHYTSIPHTNVVDWIGNARNNVRTRLGLLGGRSLRRAAEQLERGLPEGAYGRGPLRWNGSCREARTSVSAPSGSATCRSGAAQNRIEPKND